MACTGEEGATVSAYRELLPLEREMAKPRKLEEMQALLAEIRPDPTSDTGMATLRQILQSRFSIAIAQAATLIGEADITALRPELAATFDRLIENPKANDPGCLAKQAIAETLYRLNYGDAAIFRTGIHHVQMEPVWGGQEDTAAALRGTCALGLVRLNDPDVMNELADLLADPKPEARIAAARAIAYSENPQGVALLRLRLRVGDTPPVLSECVLALLKLAPTQASLAQVTRLLNSHEASAGESVAIAEAVALALGESRAPGAFVILRDWWQSVRDPELRQSGLMAIAMLRQDEAIEFLLSLIAEGSTPDGKNAIHALSVYRQDARLWQRVCETVEERGNQLLSQFLAKMA